MGSDQFDALVGERSVEPVAVVGLVADDARWCLGGHHEVKEALYGVTLVRTCLGCIGSDWQSLGIDQQHDFHSLAHAGYADAVTTLTRFAERGVNKTLVEFEAVSSSHATSSPAHDALELAGLCPAVKPIVHRAFGAELGGKVLPLGSIVQNPKNALHHLALVGRWTATLRTAWGIGNLLKYPIKLFVSKLKHVTMTTYPIHSYNEVFG